MAHYEQMQNLLQLYQNLGEAEALDAAGQQGITHAEMMAQLKAKMA